MDPESNESEPIPDGNPECRLDLALLGVWLAASSLTVSAHEMRLKALNIVHPFVFETEQSEAALHVRIKNTSRAAERLLGHLRRSPPRCPLSMMLAEPQEALSFLRAVSSASNPQARASSLAD
jgi:hypothetical protein